MGWSLLRKYFNKPIRLLAAASWLVAAGLSGCVSDAAQTVELPETDPINQEFFYLEDPNIRIFNAMIDHDNVTFHGALIAPIDRPVIGGAIIVFGSGPTERSQAWSVFLADILVDSGYAVLLHDKRGSGQTGGDWRDSTFETRIGDELAAIEFLKRQTLVDVPVDNIGVMGLSQGGMIAPELAMRMQPRAAFVIDISGAATSVREQLAFELANTHRYDEHADDAYLPALAQIDEITLRRLAGESCAEFGERTCWEQYLQRLDALGEVEKLAETLATYPRTKDLWWFRYTAGIIKYDPGEYWKKLDPAIPVYAAYGALDERDNTPVHESARRLRAIFHETGQMRYRIRIFDHTGHAIHNPEADHLEILPELVEDLTGWMSSLGSAGSPRGSERED